MPIAGLHVPVVAGEHCVAGARGEIEDLEGSIVGRGEEFRIARSPGEIANSIVVRVVNRFNVVEIRSPVFNVASLSTGD